MSSGDAPVPMKHVDEYRSPDACRNLAKYIAETVTRPWTLMEICGGQTHAILRYGLDQLLPPGLTLLHGPGCPVCVTPAEAIDAAIELARRPNVTLCVFGDMMRVPGSRQDLFGVKAEGGDVRMVYSPLDAVCEAVAAPDREFVFFAIGFETTAPGCALALREARARGLNNFSLLVAHVLVPPAIEAVLSAPGCAVQALLAPGHVCAVTGLADYEAIARRHGTPIAVTGFEPIDILFGILDGVRQLEAGQAEVTNMYQRVVRAEGNPSALAVMNAVFQVSDRRWRGLGLIPNSGLALRPEWAEYDAEIRFGLESAPTPESDECLAGQVLQGLLKPTECPAFGTRCSPDHPLGATMVSSEGACAAYYRYRRDQG